MFKHFWKVIGTLVGVAFTANPLLAANVLSNPGLELDAPIESQNIIGWTWFGQGWGNTFTEYGAGAHTGSNYFKVFQGFTGFVNYNGIFQDYISGPGATYTADGWAKTAAGDVIAGQNQAWVEVSFRDADGNILALYRSSLITTNAVATGKFPANTWVDLKVTNQYNTTNFTITNTTTTLVAPAGTYFLRYQVVLQGDAAGSNGSVYFDDLNLNLLSSAPYGNWNIVWSDEFNGTSINTNTWTYDIGNGGSNPGWGNSELEYYTSRTNNAYAGGGLLHIVALKESFGGQSFTSARIKSQGLVSWKYGRFEWRAKFPAGTGFWPALWFLGTNIVNVGWPGCGEIDVTENNGGVPNFSQGSLHSGSDETAIYNLLSGDSVTNFHNYVLDWSTNSFLFYVDGHLYETQSNWSSSLGDAYPAPFNKPCFIIMNLAVGGNFTASNGVNPSVSDISKSTFPSELQVDYVRVYNQTPPLKISFVSSNNSLLVSWPTNIVGHLQAAIGTNSASMGTNWADLTQSTNPLRVVTTNKSAFYRLQSP